MQVYGEPDDKPIVVYTIVPQIHSASFYYRLQVPILTAVDLGLPIRACIDTMDAATKQEDRVRAFCESDVTILYQPISDEAVANVRAMQSFIPSKRDEGWKWPPSIVIETDDNLFNVSPLNQAYRGLGTRDLEGNEVPIGHEIGIVSNGDKKILWRDGHKGFNIGKNRHTLSTYRNLLSMADAVCCSTQPVADAVLKETTPRRIQVFPNMVRLDHYEQVDLADDPYTIKILWQGGIAHYEDWFPLRQALGNITKQYPEVHWIIWGAQFPWVQETIPPHRFTFKSWCDYREYKLRLAMIGHDISLAPLSSHVFNDCRSAIKFYEASVLKKPAATLAQNTAAYKREIIDGETALLFNDPKDFEEKLSLLIEDTKERKRLAANAKDWVSENRDARKMVPEIVAFWQSLREDRKREQPHVSDEHWKEIEEQAAREAAEQEGTDATLQPVDASVG